MDEQTALKGRNLVIRGKRIRIATVEDEADLDLLDPERTIKEVAANKSLRADIFSFCQRPPDIIPSYSYALEWDAIAVLEYVNYKHWFEVILNDKTRNMIRKAGKRGVDIRAADYDDEFVKGIVGIYNESPIRQGRAFKHYGKSFEDVKKANATHLERSEFIGAYLDRELIGFIKIAYGDRTARIEQILSINGHRDKAPTNALLARAVERCEKMERPFIIYGIWPKKESFAKFKLHNGFKRYALPRYYIPLNKIGAVAVKLGLYREVKNLVPDKLREYLVGIRERWNSYRIKKA